VNSLHLTPYKADRFSPDLPAQGEKMRISHSLAIAVAGFALAGSAMAVAQSANLIDKPEKINGYVDLKTGLFHPLPQVTAAPETTPTFVTYSGHIEVILNTTLAGSTLSSLPKGYTILCDVNLNGYVNNLVYEEVGSSPATVNGNIASCTVNIPISWKGEAGGSGYYFNGSYKVTASYAPGGATQPLTDFNVIRQTTGVLNGPGGIVAFTIPSGGVTTTIALDPVI
jgi:hypothetical protein